MHLKSKVKIVLLLIFIVLFNTESSKFERNVIAVGPPYFMIVMTLGECTDHVLFKEQKVWGAVNLNQVMDIYYKSDGRDIRVSQVEIRMVINNTNVFAMSENGVGSNEFSATVFVPIRVGVILYQLTIFSCNRPHTENIYNIETSEEVTKSPQKALNEFEDDEEEFSPEDFEKFKIEHLWLKKKNKTDQTQ